MSPIEFIASLRRACPVGCRVEVRDDIDPHRVRVIWSFRIAGQRQAYAAWMRQEMGAAVDCEAWLEAVGKLMREDIAKMKTHERRGKADETRGGTQATP